VDPRTVPQPAVGSDRAAAVANAHSAVVRSRMAEAGEPPVDAERVAEIARAIEQDRYPVLPMNVADAIIAAGLLLRSGK
jgi:negative regulator of flagellin synthesis FlgM